MILLQHVHDDLTLGSVTSYLLGSLQSIFKGVLRVNQRLQPAFIHPLRDLFE